VLVAVKEDNMPIGYATNYRPGQELRKITVLRPETRGTDNGREGLTNQYVEVGTIRAIFAQARPEEIERWRQLDHTVTHKIIMQRKPPFDIRPGDIFEHGGRRFYHSMTPDNVGDLDHWTIFYCSERDDAT
jgi:hypothetical protein